MGVAQWSDQDHSHSPVRKFPGSNLVRTLDLVKKKRTKDHSPDLRESEDNSFNHTKPEKKKKDKSPDLRELIENDENDNSFNHSKPKKKKKDQNPDLRELIENDENSFNHSKPK